MKVVSQTCLLSWGRSLQSNKLGKCKCKQKCAKCVQLGWLYLVTVKLYYIDQSGKYPVRINENVFKEICFYFFKMEY